MVLGAQRPCKRLFTFAKRRFRISTALQDGPGLTGGTSPGPSQGFNTHSVSDRTKHWTDQTVPRLLSLAVAAAASSGYWYLQSVKDANNILLDRVQLAQTAIIQKREAYLQSRAVQYQRVMTREQEQERVLAEKERERGEQQRIASELERMNTSMAMVVTEQVRVNEEIKRVKGEQERRTAEDERAKSAVLQIQQCQQALEETMQAEASRNRSELGRLAAEAERVASVSKRIAEAQNDLDKRLEVEQMLAHAERGRVAGEEMRTSEELKRRAYDAAERNEGVERVAKDENNVAEDIRQQKSRRRATAIKADIERLKCDINEKRAGWRSHDVVQA